MSLKQHKKQKASGNKKRLVILAAFAVPLFITSGVSTQTNQSFCDGSYNDNQSISQCLANSGANNSWIAWLSGNSRSTQFQMIDLFELVNRPNDNQRKPVVNVREG